MVVNGKTMNQISADAPGHTFTLQSPPDAPNAPGLPTRYLSAFLCLGFQLTIPMLT